MTVNKADNTITVTHDELKEAFSSGENYRQFIRKLDYTVLTEVYGYSKQSANHIIKQWYKDEE